MTNAKPRRAPILDGRLSVALALAGTPRVFADVGADHGRLSAALLLRGAQRAVVSDVSAAALQKARRRLHGLGLEERAVCCVADGLDALDAIAPDAPDTVFILGMGGDTISGILRRGVGKLHGAALILGAQTELPLLRKELMDVGYRIRDEVVANENRRDYVLMRCTPAQTDEPAYDERALLLGPVLLQKRPAAWQAVLARRKRLLLKGVSAMRKAALPKDAERLTQFERELGYVEDALQAYAGDGREGCG